MSDLLARLLDEADGALPITLDGASDDEIGKAIGELADRPIAPDLFIGLCRSGDDRSLRAAQDIVAISRDPAVMAEIVRSIACGLPFEDRWSEAFHRALIGRAADRGGHYGLRSEALLGALQLSQADAARMFGLLGLLVRLSPDDDPDFLKHASKIVGLVQAHRPQPELEALLSRIAAIAPAREEAAMELGLIALRRGLEQRDRTAALEAFTSARDWFRESAAATEVRTDADLYLHSVQMLIDFQGGRRSGPAAAEVEAIRKAAFRYVAWSVPTDRRLDGSWLVDRLSEAMHWATLATNLAALEESLADGAWLDASVVIERQLLACYSASRSTLRLNRDGGVEEIVRPAIVDAVQRDQVQLALLDKWIDRNEGSDMILDASALRQSVVAAREASVLRNPTEAAVPTGVVAALLTPGLVTPAGKTDALGAITLGIAGRLVASTPAVVLERMQAFQRDLASNPHYADNETARLLFDTALFHTLNYQYSRENVQTKSRNGTEYLFDLSSVKPPIEADLHRDYFGDMQTVMTDGGIRKEAEGIAHGRADVVFHEGDVSIVGELKKTDADRTLQELLDDHGLQSTAYQRTNVRLAILIVLDLVDRGGGGDHFEASSEILWKTPAMTTTSYSVAVFRIQGRKRSPSNVKDVIPGKGRRKSPTHRHPSRK